MDSISRHEPCGTLHGHARAHSLESGRPNPELSGGGTGSPATGELLEFGTDVTAAAAPARAARRAGARRHDLWQRFQWPRPSDLARKRGATERRYPRGEF